MPTVESNTTAVELSRRGFLTFGGFTLSAAAVALLAGKPRLALAAAARGDDGANDVSVLNSAIASELEAVAAYELGAKSGLLKPPVLDLARQFQGHHKAHADLLAGAVHKLGGQPSADKAQYDFPTDKLKSQADVVRFAAGLERGAVTAYVGAIPVFDDRELSRAAATILADEAMHLAVLRQALGENPVPQAFWG